MIDNSWATPVYFKPLAHGVDLSIQAAPNISAAIPTRCWASLPRLTENL